MGVGATLGLPTRSIVGSVMGILSLQHSAALLNTARRRRRLTDDIFDRDGAGPDRVLHEARTEAGRQPAIPSRAVILAIHILRKAPASQRRGRRRSTLPQRRSVLRAPGAAVPPSSRCRPTWTRGGVSRERVYRAPCGGGAEKRNLLAPSPRCCKQRRATTTYRLPVPLGTPPLLNV